VTNAAPQSAAQPSTTAKDSKTTQYEIGKTVVNTIKGAGEIKRLSVAVFIDSKAAAAPAAAGAAAGAAAAPAAAAVDPEVVKKLVRTAVGAVTEGKGKRNDEVEVAKIEFAPQPPLAAEAKPGAMDNFAKYLTWGGQILLVILAGGLLFWFLSLLKGAKQERLKTDLAFDELLSEKTGGRLTGGTGRAITVGELSKLIRENPSNVSQSLKNWLGQS